MKRKDFLLALLVVIVWGANFTAIKLGLDGVPSMVLVALRYTLVAFPAVFFVKKPDTDWKYIIYYGFSVGVGQFGCLFYAMEVGMPAGLASIIVQLQAFISPILGYVLLKERLKSKQVIGFFIAAIGLILIGYASTTNSITSIPLAALLLTIMAPVFWSISSIVLRKAKEKAAEEEKELNMLSMVVWGALIPPIPILGLALLIDTPATILSSLTNLTPMSVFSVIYLSFVATLFGYGYWSILITKYPLAKISPISLLVPITGLLTSRIILAEKLSSLQWLGVIIILIGLIFTNIDIKKLTISN